MAQDQARFVESLEQRQFMSATPLLGGDFFVRSQPAVEMRPLRQPFDFPPTAKRPVAQAETVDFQRPTARISLPVTGSEYHGGNTVRFVGQGFDHQDGRLGDKSLTWTITRHVGNDVQVVRRVKGSDGKFTIPKNGPGAANQFYRFTLTVVDSDGRRDSTFVDLRPRLAGVSLNATVTGVRLELDGVGTNGDDTVPSVVGTRRTVSAPGFATIDGVRYRFAGWSDGGRRVHDIDVRFGGQQLTAFYRLARPRAPLFGPRV